ncbi:MAG TPA: IS66 family transposase [Candidatus Saccharimonadales bacterium]|nr:IS66 family transposase [Candidatus Saccharimonadales bacterium]
MTEEAWLDLQKENAELKAALAQKEQRIQELEGLLMGALLRVEELERRFAKDSHNSSLPPSRDHGTRKPLGKRPKSQKRSGGQQGHQGHTLMLAKTPDEVLIHRPASCPSCQTDLREQPGVIVERRQVHDVPTWRLQVWEHQVEAVCCPGCQQRIRGHFPASVSAPVQYGPGVQALAVYLSQSQLVPVQRTCETLADLFEAPVSQASVLEWVGRAGERLASRVEQIAQWIERAAVMHVDETSVHLRGKVHWIHVHSTARLTLYRWHAKRGTEGIQAVSLVPGYRGRMMHDRWTSYDRYPCAHSLCGAHLIRDTLFVAEHEQQPWASRMVEHLRQMDHVSNQWREQGARHLPAEVRQELLAEYFDILRTGYAAHAGQPPPPKKAGRRKQNPSLNLLDTFLKRAEHILGFLDDLCIPFTNNLAERDLRMIKVQQKISGTFRSPDGITAFCALRSYLSTMRKQGRPLLSALRAVFVGTPFPIAWQPGT